MMNNGLTPQALMQRITQIRNTMGGDPNQHIQQLLNSGKITQADYDKAVKQAEQLRKMMGM